MGDHVLEVGSGDILRWPPGHDHVLLEASADFELFVIGVTEEFSARVLSERVARGLNRQIRARVPSAQLSRWKAICSATSESLDVSVIEAQIGELWREASTFPPIDPYPQQFTVRAINCLLDHPLLSRDAVAQLARVYPTELSRYFRRDMGLSLTLYRTRLKLLRFIHEAERGCPNCLAASQAAGFGSYSQCHRAFRSTLGCSPQDIFDRGVRAQMGSIFAPTKP
jgi:AraC-like DNA-binding protein